MPNISPKLAEINGYEKLYKVYHGATDNLAFTNWADYYLQAVNNPEFPKSLGGDCRHQATILQHELDEAGIENVIAQELDETHVAVIAVLENGEHFLLEPIYQVLDPLHLNRVLEYSSGKGVREISNALYKDIRQERWCQMVLNGVQGTRDQFAMRLLDTEHPRGALLKNKMKVIETHDIPAVKDNFKNPYLQTNIPQDRDGMIASLSLAASPDEDYFVAGYIGTAYWMEGKLRFARVVDEIAQHTGVEAREIMRMMREAKVIRNELSHANSKAIVV